MKEKGEYVYLSDNGVREFVALAFRHRHKRHLNDSRFNELGDDLCTFVYEICFHDIGNERFARRVTEDVCREVITIIAKACVNADFCSLVERKLWDNEYPTVWLCRIVFARVRKTDTKTVGNRMNWPMRLLLAWFDRRFDEALPAQPLGGVCELGRHYKETRRHEPEGCVRRCDLVFLVRTGFSYPQIEHTFNVSNSSVTRFLKKCREHHKRAPNDRGSEVQPVVRNSNA
ncbi:MAG: hypothetical protein L0Z50_09865 [Verrucomicrobiales bacterium]|nr:hypothetical protein [Verrucomicrobiales bacterium]